MGLAELLVFVVFLQQLRFNFSLASNCWHINFSS